MAQISIRKLIGKGYNNGWFQNCHARYRVFEGGRSTKKSVNIGGYEPIFKIMFDPHRNIIMSRKDDINNSSSTYPNIVALINKMGLKDLFKCHTCPYEIIYRPTGQKIVFKGCNNPEAITSTKFIVGELTDIYFEEASELDNYEDFRKIDGSVRPTETYPQITLLMNGWDKKSWIYEVFWKGRLEDDFDYLETHDYMDYYDEDFESGNGRGLYLHKSTYRINEFRSQGKDDSMKALREKALEIYKVEGLGMWGCSTQSTYMYWNSALVKMHYELALNDFVCYNIGIDFGMGNGEGVVLKNTRDRPNRYRSATVMELVAVTGDWSKLVTLQEYFDSNENRVVPKGAPEVADEMILRIMQWKELYAQTPVLMKGMIVCYVDSADSGGFRTLLEAKAEEHGLENIKFVKSTKNKIQTRVDFENLLMAFGEYLVCDRCTNLIREIGNARQAEDGRCREDTDDHCINAHEYAWIPVLNRIKRYKDFKVH